MGVTMSAEETEILVVDDSPTIRATISKYLGEEYKTQLAADGEEGWELLQSNESISLVFTDIHMPVMNGMLLLQKIRESDCERIANMPVIMITGLDDTDAAKKATHNIGATDFISKPFDKIDILSRAKSYTRLNNKITELENETAYDAETGLYNDNILLDFGNKTISFAKRQNMATSILYVEIADLHQYKEAHGDKATKTIVSSVAGLLENSLRKEELISHTEEARFAIVLPNTRAFKAHIVATRLKQSVEELVFEISNITIRINLAVGLCSTEDLNKSDSLGFEDYCVHASHALATSLDTPNKRITRYDETYEKKIGDEKGSYTSSPPRLTDTVVSDQNSTNVFGEFFASIMAGDYSNIPAEFLPSMIEPLDKFLQYAQATVDDNQKISGE
jgi:two-component system cell cycle response regulator